MTRAEIESYEPLISGPTGAPPWDYHDRAGMVDVFEIVPPDPPPPPPPPPSPVMITVAEPSVRHRGPRRGHVGARRRPGTRRVTQSSRAGPQSSDPDQGEPPGETPAEIAARRLRELEEFVALHGLDYWYRGDRTQLELGEAA